VRINFEEDIKAAMQYQLSDFKVRLPVKASLHDGLLDYLTVLRKLIRKKPRKVLYNPDFFSVLSQHPKQKEILHLQYLFEDGKDVNHFQSKRLFQANFHDHLVYEWDIFHFHLSFEKEKKGRFAKQTKQLLFVYINDTEAIFLGTDNHSSGTFGDIKWQEVLYDHFPYILDPHRDNRITEIWPKVNALERQTLWDKGYLLGMTTIRGQVFHNPGLGRTSSGHSIVVCKQVNEILRWIYIVTEQFERCYEDICNYMGISIDRANFQLQFGVKTLEVIERNSGKITLTYSDAVNEDLFLK
jgi:hypothetical protein